MLEISLICSLHTQRKDGGATGPDGGGAAWLPTCAAGAHQGPPRLLCTRHGASGICSCTSAACIRTRSHMRYLHTRVYTCVRQQARMKLHRFKATVYKWYHMHTPLCALFWRATVPHRLWINMRRRSRSSIRRFLWRCSQSTSPLRPHLTPPSILSSLFLLLVFFFLFLSLLLEFNFEFCSTAFVLFWFLLCIISCYFFLIIAHGTNCSSVCRYYSGKARTLWKLGKLHEAMTNYKESLKVNNKEQKTKKNK